MKQKLLIAILFLASIQAFAQNKKWSIEANYALVPSGGFGGKGNVIDLGLKYRFVDFNFGNLGFSFNSGFSRVKTKLSNIIFIDKKYYFQPRIFSEFTIPTVEKLRPSIGVGYSIINSRLDYTADMLSNPIDVLAPDSTDSGFNFNVGLSYEITKTIFFQVQYDYIKLKKQENSNNIRLGVGFRF